MAEWHPVHKPLDLRSGLEAGGQLYDPPLLPYEIALIEALGCSEQEYKEFVRNARDAAYVRPAEYENIPEIYAAMIPAAVVAVSAKSVATTIAVNLAIGLALTAVSLLLAPKAPALQSPARIRGKKLADQIGPTRFNQTTSFDNVSSLAEYAQPIPIPFGKRGVGADGQRTGGLVLAPALVWSRMYSYGTYQAYEGLYVVGEAGLGTPEVGGVRIGLTPLSVLSPQDYALFWSSSSGSNRLTIQNNRIAGTAVAGSAETGTSGRAQVFLAPGNAADDTTAFSMVYNTRNSAVFGTSTPIHNGSAFRFNWEVVSAPYSSTKGDEDTIKTAREETQARRRKIAGSDADVLHKYDGQPIEDVSQIGMPGVGRAYSRHMGFTKRIRGGVTTEYSNRTELTDVQVGDKLVFEIAPGSYRELNNISPTEPNGGGFRGTGINVQDLDSASESWRIRASELLTIGSKWVIAGTVWIVESRDQDMWKKSIGMSVVFRCTEILGIPKVGIPGTRTVRELLGGYEGSEFNPQKHCGANFYNVCQYHVATVRPVRRDAEVIEVGIKSQVWNKANGLCNFNAIPSSGASGRLHQMDKADITLTSPRMDKYFKRTSCFSIWVRTVPIYGQPEPAWQRMSGNVFCVSGNQPIDQYNFIRIRPRTPGFYEYKFVPRTGSDMDTEINAIGTNTVTRLDAQGGTTIGTDYSTASYGNFRLTTKGEILTVSDIQYNSEMMDDPGDIIEEIPGGTETRPSAVGFTGAPTSNNGSTQLVAHAWYSSVLGTAKDNQNATRSAQVTYTVTPAKTIILSLRATSTNTAIGSDYITTTGSRWEWTGITLSVVSATGSWANNEQFTVQRSTTGSVFQVAKGYTSVNWNIAVTATTTVTSPPRTVLTPGRKRVFENSSQVADCSHYIELSKSNENQPEHSVTYINEYVANDVEPTYTSLTTAGLSIKSNKDVSSIDQLRFWVPEGISVTRLNAASATGPSNLFTDLVYYLLTDRNQGVGSTVPSELVDVDSLRSTGRYLLANKIFFDGVIEDSESLRSFLYETASLQLCNFTIKNGRFGMMPALPTDAGSRISTTPIQPAQIFTSGNIIQDSLQLQYIDASQRTNFSALVSWRVTVENDLPTQASALVDWADIPESSRATTQQAFDLTDFCTNRAQALLTARFLLSVRRRITHTVSFKTIPDALGVEPGSYIRVITESTSYSATNNGGITDTGTLVSITTIANGTYDAIVYNPQTSEVVEKRITITNNAVTDPSVYGCLFTLVSLQANVGMYQVESLTLDEDGLVNISAVEVPVDSTGASIVAKDVLNESAFRVLE